MIDFVVRGAIFDVDDTLLDNKSAIPGLGLHERARRVAIQEAGQKYNIAALANITAEDNLRGFTTAPVHTIEAAIWNIFVMTGVADSQVINPENAMLIEIVRRKDEVYKQLLIDEGTELPGASDFVRALAATGVEDKMAIASTAIRRDVDIFVKKMQLSRYFPDSRIKTKEDITHPKPNPEIFNLAFSSLDLRDGDRAAVCAFEDDPRGIMAARGAGLFVCAICSRFRAEDLMALEVPPHVTANSYEEFMDIFGLRTVAAEAVTSSGYFGDTQQP